MKHTTINNVFVDGRAVSVRAVAGGGCVQAMAAAVVAVSQGLGSGL